MKNKRIFLLGMVGIISIGLAVIAVASAAQASTSLRNDLSTTNADNGQAPDTPAGGFTPAEVLLVDDDDNTPDVLSVYTQILDSLGYSYNIWNTGNSDVEPDFATMHQHQAVIWFTGHEFGGFAGPSSASEGELAAYLDNGGCFFISSQDYFNDRGLTPFMQNYLGVSSVGNDNGDYLSVNGQGSVYGNLGPYSLIYPFTDFSDIVTPDTSAQLAFQGVTPNTNPAGIYKDGSVYKTTFLGFPLEAFPGLFDQAQTVGKFLLDCFLTDVMVVDDDDNSPDVHLYYTQVLDQLGYHYTIWDTDNSDSEPSVVDLEKYEAVVWFSGDEFGGSAGPGTQGEADLTAWLEGGDACLFLSSQDYMYDRGVTPFMTSYLGVADGVNDVLQSVVTGTFAYGGIGPYSLTLPISMSNFSDAFTLTTDAESAFLGDQSTYSSGGGCEGHACGEKGQTALQPSVPMTGTHDASHAAGIYKHHDLYQTTFLGFPFEGLPTPLGQVRTLHRFLANCFPSDLDTNKFTSDPVVTVGETFTYTVEVVNNGPHKAVDVFIQDFIPAQLSVESINSSPSVLCNEGFGGNVNCTIPELFVGQTETIRIPVTADASGELTNFVFSTNFGADPNPADNSTSVFVRSLNPGDTTLYLDQVSPDSSENSTSRNIQILGANFTPDTVVYLNGTLFPTFTFDVDNPDAIISATLPVGFTPGSYDVLLENSGGDQASLYQGLVVFDPSALNVSAVSPGYGANDRPVTIDIFGDGFSPGMGGKLIDSVNPQNFYELFPAGYISENHFRAIVPYEVPPGLYDVEVFNLLGYTDTLASAYQVIEWSAGDDLFALDFDVFTFPASPREGQNTTLGLNVRRLTGESAVYSETQVSVHAMLEISQGGTPVATINSSDVISPNKTISMTFPWTAGVSGDYVLTFVLTSTELVTDTVPANNVISRTIYVLPPSTDLDAPQILTVTVNGGALVTDVPQVTVNTTASDAGSGVAYIYYIDYAYDQGLGDWKPLKRSGWLPFENGVDMDVLLDETSGVHYIQAWVSDVAGNISEPKFAFINLIQSKNGIIHDGGQVYRLLLPPGMNLQVELTSLLGDADIFAWDINGDLVDASFGSYPFEQINISAGSNPPGLYQVDVYGFETTSYWFEVSYNLTQEGPRSIDEVQGHVKGSDLPLQVVDDSPGGEVEVPPAPSGYSIYLPVVVR